MNEEEIKPAHHEVAWVSGAAYEAYIGRWSRLAAREFLAWLEVPTGSDWLDAGCGTGALCQTILQMADPRRLKGIDRSANFIAHAVSKIHDDRVSFETADAQALPDAADSFDAVVSGLVLNFIPQPNKAVSEMMRVAKPGGVVAAYVWDYAGKMQLIRHFFDAAAALDPKAADLDEGRRFPLCQPKPLAELFDHAGLHEVSVRAIDVPTVFVDFNDYWSPFLGGQGPAPGYCMSLSEDKRAALRERIRAGLPISRDGSISMVARAWAVRGEK
jgi:ubiquinone/menaquinone biosynthesis C-methylase UbiE